jgi:ribose-phosphate pyrophosphokinase
MLLIEDGSKGKDQMEFKLFAGTAHPALASRMADLLRVPLGKCTIERFPDGETSVELLEPVRHKEVFLIQPIGPLVNEHLVELLILADACRRAAASRITAIVPYLGYSRADKRHGRREAITASMVATVLQAIGIDHLLTVDLHAPQIQGFFQIPVDSLTAVPTLYNALKHHVSENTVVVAPDAGAVRMATEYAHRLSTSVIVVHKRRESGAETRVTHVVGDVRDRACLIVDDMITTGGTIAESIEALLKAGAHPEITVAATHGLFVSGARERLTHKSVRNIFVTDTVPVTEKDWPQLHVVMVAPLLAGAVERFMSDRSIGDLF